MRSALARNTRGHDPLGGGGRGPKRRGYQPDKPRVERPRMVSAPPPPAVGTGGTVTVLRRPGGVVSVGLPLGGRLADVPATAALPAASRIVFRAGVVRFED